MRNPLAQVSRIAPNVTHRQADKQSFKWTDRRSNRRVMRIKSLSRLNGYDPAMINIIAAHSYSPSADRPLSHCIGLVRPPSLFSPVGQQPGRPIYKARAVLTGRGRARWRHLCTDRATWLPNIWMSGQQVCATFAAAILDIQTTAHHSASG